MTGVRLWKFKNIGNDRLPEFSLGTGSNGLKKLHQRSLTWRNSNILKFSFGNLEMQHKIELHVDKNWGNIMLFLMQKETLLLQYANKLLT